MPLNVVPLSVPVQISAGNISGVAVACAHADGMQYLVVPYQQQEGAPVWINEADVENCYLVPALVRQRN